MLNFLLSTFVRCWLTLAIRFFHYATTKSTPLLIEFGFLSYDYLSLNKSLAVRPLTVLNKMCHKVTFQRKGFRTLEHTGNLDGCEALTPIPSRGGVVHSKSKLYQYEFNSLSETFAVSMQTQLYTSIHVQVLLNYFILLL